MPHVCKATNIFKNKLATDFENAQLKSMTGEYINDESYCFVQKSICHHVHRQGIAPGSARRYEPRRWHFDCGKNRGRIYVRTSPVAGGG